MTEKANSPQIQFLHDSPQQESVAKKGTRFVRAAYYASRVLHGKWPVGKDKTTASSYAEVLPLIAASTDDEKLETTLDTKEASGSPRPVLTQRSPARDRSHLSVVPDLKPQEQAVTDAVDEAVPEVTESTTKPAPARMPTQLESLEDKPKLPGEVRSQYIARTMPIKIIGAEQAPTSPDVYVPRHRGPSHRKAVEVHAPSGANPTIVATSHALQTEPRHRGKQGQPLDGQGQLKDYPQYTAGGAHRAGAPVEAVEVAPPPVVPELAGVDHSMTHF